MPKTDLYNMEGNVVGEVELKDSIFGVEVNEDALYIAVEAYLANQRQGTHKAKARSEIAGSTRKLGRQKGGGGARPGDIKSPVRVGGGRIFGPGPRDYSFKLNKKVKQLARKSALSYKAQNNEIVVVDAFQFEAPKTKNMVAVLTALKAECKKTLIILPDANKNVYLSAKNLERVNVLTASELNTYSIMNAKAVIMTEESVAAVDQIFNV